MMKTRAPDGANKLQVYFLRSPKGQTFWSEGSANTETFSKVELFKEEDCSNPKVDDGGNKDC